jgi:universal stress protein A
VKATPKLRRERNEGNASRPVAPVPLRLHNILVPLDFSESSLKALEYALSLGGQYASTLHLLHVLEPPAFIAGLESLPVVVPMDELAGVLQKKLAALARERVPASQPCVPRVVTGRTYEEIIAVARSIEADLIIIATHGYTGLKHLVLGSTAERVIQHAPCPVLVVRERELEVGHNPATRSTP